MRHKTTAKSNKNYTKQPQDPNLQTKNEYKQQIQFLAYNLHTYITGILSLINKNVSSNVKTETHNNFKYSCVVYNGAILWADHIFCS